MTIVEKIPKKTDLDRLNDLIEWYEKNKPAAGQRIPVALGPQALARMLGRSVATKDPIKEHEYRGRIVYATGKDPERRK